MLHIYNQNLECIDSIPRTMQQVEEFGISTLYPKWQTKWYLSEVKYNYPKLENGNLVEKTQEELKLEGIIPLQDGEVIINNELVVKPKPNGVKIEWQSPNWVETATQEEIQLHEFEEAKVFYNSELVFATKATTEMACKIITEEQYQEVEIYMNSINPYRTKMNLRAVNRPAIFDRYN